MHKQVMKKGIRLRTILTWNYEIIYVVRNREPYRQDPQSQNQTSNDINQAVHSQIYPSWQ